MLLLRRSSGVGQLRLVMRIVSEGQGTPTCTLPLGALIAARRAAPAPPRGSGGAQVPPTWGDAAAQQAGEKVAANGRSVTGEKRAALRERRRAATGKPVWGLLTVSRRPEQQTVRWSFKTGGSCLGVVGVANVEDAVSPALSAPCVRGVRARKTFRATIGSPGCAGWTCCAHKTDVVLRLSRCAVPALRALLMLSQMGAVRRLGGQKFLPLESARRTMPLRIEGIRGCVRTP